MTVMRRDDAERWKTVRAAIAGGWGTTLRYVVIACVPTTLGILGLWFARHL